MKKPRKKISKMGWGVKWQSGKFDFYTNQKTALREIEYFDSEGATLFRCKIEEVTK